MAEIKREPIVRDDGDSVTFDADHTHSDILRYVIGDLGAEDAVFLMNLLAEEVRVDGNAA
ncbi:hypothetical protein [Sphingomonas sp. R86520]|uniref:hypothetical protein n=1 Tax=Sphingomonas sp. R86520 TaxID=3093859 RepID=UPI0036D3BB91